MQGAAVVHGELVPLPGLDLAVLHPLLHPDLELGDLLGLARRHQRAGGQQQRAGDTEVHEEAGH